MTNTKVEIIVGAGFVDLQKKVNKFIKDLDVLNVTLSYMNNCCLACVLYKSEA